MIACSTTHYSQDLAKKSLDHLLGGGGATQPGRLLLLPMYEHIEAEARQHGVLELGIVVHNDRHNAHVREEAPSSTNHVLSVQPELSWSIKPPVVHTVVVSLCEELD